MSLQNKWGSLKEGIHLNIRMLNGQMRQVVLPSHATVEDLYDFVFSETEGNCYFSITKSFPTMLINEMGKSLMEVVGDMESVTVNRI